MIKTQITFVHNRHVFRDLTKGEKVVIEGQSAELNKYAFVAKVTTVPWRQKFSRILFRSLYL